MIRPGSKPGARDTRADVLRPGLLRSARGAGRTQDRACGHRSAGANVSVPGKRRASVILSRYPALGRSGVGAGRAAQHGRMAIRPGANAAHSRDRPAASLRYIGRAESASTSTGSLKRHQQEQAELVEGAFAAEIRSPMGDAGPRGGSGDVLILCCLSDKPNPSGRRCVHYDYTVFLVPEHAPTPALYVLASGDVSV